mmetsp:Transcript_43340/g.119900  ORF Transcript_43340/g.119900 Transcript_43340/m.119900 type:complete len:241 (-) Transcript_43340:19-741(-)
MSGNPGAVDVLGCGAGAMMTVADPPGATRPKVMRAGARRAVTTATPRARGKTTTIAITTAQGKGRASPVTTAITELTARVATRAVTQLIRASTGRRRGLRAARKATERPGMAGKAAKSPPCPSPISTTPWRIISATGSLGEEARVAGRPAMSARRSWTMSSIVTWGTTTPRRTQMRIKNQSPLAFSRRMTRTRIMKLMTTKRTEMGTPIATPRTKRRSEWARNSFNQMMVPRRWRYRQQR